MSFVVFLRYLGASEGEKRCKSIGFVVFYYIWERRRVNNVENPWVSLFFCDMWERRRVKSVENPLVLLFVCDVWERRRVKHLKNKLVLLFFTIFGSVGGRKTL